MWCGLDLSDYGKSSFVKTAVEELKRCHKMGAYGVGEVTDKGWVYMSLQTNMTEGIHLNDPLMSPIYGNLCRVGDAIEYPCSRALLDVSAR